MLISCSLMSAPCSREKYEQSFSQASFRSWVNRGGCPMAVKPPPIFPPSLSLALVSAYSLCLPPTSTSEYCYRQTDPGLRARKSSAGAQHTETLEERCGFSALQASIAHREPQPLYRHSLAWVRQRPFLFPRLPSIHLPADRSMDPSYLSIVSTHPSIHPSIHPTFYTSHTHKRTHTFCVQFLPIHPLVHPIFSLSIHLSISSSIQILHNPLYAHIKIWCRIFIRPSTHAPTLLPPIHPPSQPASQPSVYLSIHKSICDLSSYIRPFYPSTESFIKNLPT